jgi:hypothetical protein
MYEDEALAARIEQAFAEVPYPGEDRLVDDPRHWEGGQSASAFAGKDWRTLPLDFLGENLFSLYYFTPEAFRYHLPAYVLASLRKLSDAEERTSAGNVSHTVGCCLYPEAGDALDRLRTRVSGLTPEQKGVLRDYVRWREWHPDRVGLWEKDEAVKESREYWQNVQQN